MKLDKYDLILALVYIVSLVMVGSLSYQEGEYDGMKNICKEKGIYLNFESYECYTKEDVARIKQNRQPEANLSFMTFEGVII